MAHFRVAKRYAKGLMDFIADFPGKEELVMIEMKQLQQLIKENRDLRNFFNSPVLDNHKKVEITKNIFQNFSEESKTFIALVIKQGRSEALESIASEYLNLYRKKNNIQKAIITSAQPLSPEQQEAIVQKAKANLPQNAQIEVENKINPELIGGFILRLNDKQFDASLKTKLDNIRKKFDTNHYIPKF